MDVSAFMSGYFLGLIAGFAVFVWWTYKFGRFLPEENPFTKENFAIVRTHISRWWNFAVTKGRELVETYRPKAEKPKEDVAFTSRRADGNVTPAE